MAAQLPLQPLDANALAGFDLRDPFEHTRRFLGIELNGRSLVVLDEREACAFWEASAADVAEVTRRVRADAGLDAAVDTLVAPTARSLVRLGWDGP